VDECECPEEGEERDCAGMCGGLSVEDECGVCGGSGVDATTACCSNTGAGLNGEVADCAGVCGGTSVLSGCDNACNSTAVEDCAGVCGGSATYCFTVTDIDGNTYKTIKIDDQWWMAENLKVTHYNNENEIPTGYSDSEWKNLSTGAYAVYDDAPSNADIYGNLYNWYTVDDSRGVCPAGWHVPSDDEYTVLTDYLGGSAGGKMKEAGLDHWNSPNTGATNESGFTGLPAGYRCKLDGSYINMGNLGYFWASTDNNSGAWKRQLKYDNSTVNRSSGANKRNGFSIRCLKD